MTKPDNPTANGWWARLRQRHWDIEFIDNDPDAPGWWKVPLLRRLAGWFAQQWHSNPLGVIGAAAAVVAAIASVMAALQ